MTPRQRVQTALEHQEPDRVPLDFGTGGNSSPTPEFYANLKTHLGIQSETRLLPHYLRLAHVDESVLQKLSIDTRHILMHPTTRYRRPCNTAGQSYDEWGVRWKEVNAGEVTYSEMAESPLATAKAADLAAYQWWPNAIDPERFRGLHDEAERLHKTTDYALVGAPGFNGVWERAWYMCGLERALEGLLQEQDFMHALLSRIADACKAALGCYLDQVGPYIQIIKLADDLGTQNGPMMSPATYRRMIKPYHKKLIDFVKRRTNAKIFFHTCGSVYSLLPDLIDAGVEILNPVQASAKDMDTRQLKSEFGRRISFMGAIDTQTVLPHGSPADVKREVEQRIAELAPGGGYIVAPTHNVQGDVPPENLIALYSHAQKVGQYPIAHTMKAQASKTLEIEE
ncbi:MAG TPA: uroporphyrinogen decarboxylase family protein [Anaerolineae bacterium]